MMKVLRAARDLAAFWNDVDTVNGQRRHGEPHLSHDLVLLGVWVRGFKPLRASRICAGGEEGVGIGNTTEYETRN